MNKTEALEMLGGTVTSAAHALDITYNAVKKWPDPLPNRIADRVRGAAWRIGQVKKRPARVKEVA